MEKYVFRLAISVGQRKKRKKSPHEESNLRSSVPRSDALQLSRRDYGERGLLRSSYETRPAYC